MIKVSYNRCKDIHKFGNKYLPSAYKTQVDFRSHFSGKSVCLIVREIRYIHSEIHNVVALVKCLLVLRYKLYMFQNVTVHPEEPFCRYWFFFTYTEHAPLLSVVLHARLQFIYIYFLISINHYLLCTLLHIIKVYRLDKAATDLLVLENEVLFTRPHSYMPYHSFSLCSGVNTLEQEMLH